MIVLATYLIVAFLFWIGLIFLDFKRGGTPETITQGSGIFFDGTPPIVVYFVFSFLWFVTIPALLILGIGKVFILSMYIIVTKRPYEDSFLSEIRRLW